MTEQQPSTLPAIIEKPESIIKLIEETVPRMQKSSSLAVDALNKMKKATTDEEFEENNLLLLKVKKTYDMIKDQMRMPITQQLDELKEFLMQFEKPLNYDSKAKSLYQEKRQLQEDYQADKLAEKKRLEAEAAKIKAREDYKTAIKQQVLTNLSDMVASKVRDADVKSKEYFDKSTLENWEDRARTFMSWKPKLKDEDYVKCFDIADGNGPLSTEEYNVVMKMMLQEEPHSKWEAIVLEKTMPIINEWRAKIPALKQQLIERQNAASEEERQRIEAEQKAKAEAEARARQAAIDKAAEEERRKIEQDAEAEKMKNSFQQQAIVQQAEHVPTQKILRFTKPETPSALVEIIYVCFANPKFPGIIKKDKSGNPVFDKDGRPEYIAAVEWWINFFVKNCDMDKYKITDTLVDEVAKVTVRK